ncbi:pentapeptide repeat-containing protein [Oscillatoria sp. CS-180]|uniref:pentapeptide repeat-containing protein n=1 Tax=Oscillatoria sp. CS-180 TaxID=3021720 RepID=UPI00232CB8A6|nr:pentapeptide repeat-containing protein [Oscillatoria sp. CS-180]MDB9528500.1 pentapeptide repeat-containing protein [Oscillatoria sp. CS-180]
MNFMQAKAIALRFVLSILLAAIVVVGSMPAHADSYDRQNLRMADFSNRDLRGDDFTRADLANADLHNADLSGSRLFDTTLSQADMEGANMTGATLDGARFIRTNLTNAILEGAYAFDTDFRGAIIDGADFTDVLLDPKVNNMLCEVAKGTNPVTGRNTRETLYCP